MQRGQHTTSLIGGSLGNYTIKRTIGSGGMGTVYLAEQEHIGKKVAIKVLHPQHVDNREIAERFFQEARAVNEINHPNIVDILDYKVTSWRDQPLAYFVMEYVEGQSVATLARERAPLPIVRALHICRQVADALAASHAKGIIHRDLKPDNLMITRRGREIDVVKVLDFGVARLVEKPPGAIHTSMGRILGTPEYMAPEQWDGKSDHRVDIYALGIVLYRLLTGKLPFPGKGFSELFSQHKTGLATRPSVLVSGIPPQVDVVVVKALAKSPDDRYGSMESFARALGDPDGYVTGLLLSMGPIMPALQDVGRMSPMVLMPVPQRVTTQPGTVAMSSQPSLLVPPVAISHHSVTSAEWSRPVHKDSSQGAVDVENVWFLGDSMAPDNDDQEALAPGTGESGGRRRWLALAVAALLVAGVLVILSVREPAGSHAAVPEQEAPPDVEVPGLVGAVTYLPTQPIEPTQPTQISGPEAESVAAPEAPGADSTPARTALPAPPVAMRGEQQLREPGKRSRGRVKDDVQPPEPAPDEFDPVLVEVFGAPEPDSADDALND